jgi:hypothetical protein
MDAIEAIERYLSVMALADVITDQRFTLVVGRKAIEVTGTPVIAVAGFHIIRGESPFHIDHCSVLQND